MRLGRSLALPMRLGGSLALPISVDFSAYHESADFRVTRERDVLIINWYGENGISLRLSLNLVDPEKLIAELSHAASSAAGRKILLKDAAPAYRVTTGKRSGGWDNFFDSPASRPHEISEYFSKLVMEGCRVVSEGRRLRAGKAYRTGSAADMFNLIEREGDWPGKLTLARKAPPVIPTRLKTPSIFVIQPG